MSCRGGLAALGLSGDKRREREPPVNNPHAPSWSRSDPMPPPRTKADVLVAGRAHQNGDRPTPARAKAEPFV
jgi:hypothetical protein